MRPYVTLSEKEVEDLTTTGIYVAGFLDPAIRSREDLYDVLVDLTNMSIAVADHAKGKGERDI